MSGPKMGGRVIRSSAQTSNDLSIELDRALANPNEIFGYARYGDGKRWVQLDKKTGGIQERSLGVLASRPKRGKSMLAAAWLPYIAEQALLENKVVRVVTLEMTRKAYQRRMASIMAGIEDPRKIRQGFISGVEERRYRRALKLLGGMPIEYLSNEEDLSQEDALIYGNSPVTFEEMAAFVRRGDTFWWLLDHIGLLHDMRGTYGGDATSHLVVLANKLAGLAHTTATGLVITHLTRLSVGSMPTIESISGSDQVGKNADQIFLLSRPWMDSPNLSEEDRALIEPGEPAYLQFYSRDEGTDLVVLWWDRKLATFDEIPMDPGVKIPLPPAKKGR